MRHVFRNPYTRFASRHAHASSRSPSLTSSPPFASHQPSTSRSTPVASTPPGPSNESPQEKVARLRAASRLAKAKASMSPLDRAIDRGRRVADKLHRIVAYGLIGFTGIASLVSIYAVIDIVIHNRRQKRAWIERELQRLHEARQAFLRGDPTPEQLHLLQQERAGDEMVEKTKRDRERKKRESWWGKGKAALGFGAAVGVEGEKDGEKYGKVENRAETEEALPGERLLDEERWTGDWSGGKGVTQAVRDMVEERRRGEKEVERVTGLRGGSLDLLAENATEAVRDKAAASRGWLSWGRPKNDP